MPSHVALLRGINVGGRNRVPMADLRAAVTALGHTEVETYIQSGNVVFTPSGPPEADLPALLRAQIARTCDVDCEVVVIAHPELAAVVAANPYPEETDPRRLHAVFRATPLDAGQLDAVRAALGRAREKGSADDATAIGRTLYLRTPGGLGRSVLAAELAKPAVGATGTARNWATVTTLLDLLG